MCGTNVLHRKDCQSNIIRDSIIIMHNEAYSHTKYFHVSMPSHDHIGWQNRVTSPICGFRLRLIIVSIIIPYLQFGVIRMHTDKLFKTLNHVVVISSQVGIQALTLDF